MSKDKIRPLMKAVADLPEHHTGLVLGVVKALSGENAPDAALVIGQAMTFLRRDEEVYLRIISSGHSIIIDATDGSRTFTGAKDVFTGYLDPDFTNYGCDAVWKLTTTTQVEVYEMIKNGKFENIFNSVGRTLDSLCLTQDQIIGFVKKHREWLRTGGLGTFFLFKVGDKFFVAGVYLAGAGQLKAYVRPFSYDDVWRAGLRPRFVLPQLTA